MTHDVWNPNRAREIPECKDPCRKPEPHLLGSEGCDFIWTYEDGVQTNPERKP